MNNEHVIFFQSKKMTATAPAVLRVLASSVRIADRAGDIIRYIILLHVILAIAALKIMFVSLQGYVNLFLCPFSPGFRR